MYIRLQSNWISYSLSPKLPFSYIHLYTNLLPLFALILQDISSGRPSFLSAPFRAAPELFSLSSDIFIFRWVGSNAFAATAFMNTIDTNHLQVISQGGELNSQISLEVAVWKRSHFLCLLFYILPIFLVFSSSSPCRLLTDSKKHEQYFWRTLIFGGWVCNN